MDKALFTLICIMILSSCAHKAGSRVDKIVLQAPVSVNSPDNINESDVLSDIGFLKEVFANGYVGFHFQEAKIRKDFEVAVHQLALHASLLTETKNFCASIARILSEIPDNHLEIYRNGQNCLAQTNSTLPPVNIAYSPGGKSFWKIDHRSVGKDKIPIVGVTKFPDPSEAGWNDFKEAFLRATHAPAIIFDLRGNSGGHLGMGAWMANVLGEKDLSPWDAAWDLVTPEANAIRLNGLVLKKSAYMASGNVVPRWLEDQIQEPPPESSEVLVAVQKNIVSESGSPYSGKIVILADHECGSTCEATILLFKKMKGIKVIGENTSGAYSYGNAGRLVLPFSRIMIQMPTRAFIHPKDVFEEKRGIVPDIKSPRNDALEKAISLLAEWLR